MCKLFFKVKSYINRLGIFQFGLIKVCLIALGVILGLSAPPKLKKPIFITAFLVFISTYVSVMSNFFKFMISKE